MRLALGASRWRVARQLIVESLVLAVPAAAAGLALVTVTARRDRHDRVAGWRAAPRKHPVATRARRPRDGVSRRDGCRLRRAHHARPSRAPRGHAPGSGVARRSLARQTWFASAIGTGGYADRRMRPVSHRCRRLLDQSSRLANPPLNLATSGVERRIDTAVRPKVAAQLASEAAVQSVAGAWRMPMGNSLPTTAVKASTTNIATSVGYGRVAE